MTSLTQAKDDNDKVVPRVMKPRIGGAQTILSGTATIVAFENGDVVRVAAYGNIFIGFSPTKTAATTANTFMPNGRVEYFKIERGDVYLGALSIDGSSGTAYVDVME